MDNSNVRQLVRTNFREATRAGRSIAELRAQNRRLLLNVRFETKIVMGPQLRSDMIKSKQRCPLI